MRGRVPFGGSLLAAALFLAACVGGVVEPDVPEEVPNPGGDLEASQPFRSLPTAQVVAIRRAVAEVRDRCMADRGFPQFLEVEVPDEAITALDDIGLGTYTFGPVTEEEARRFGYSPLLGFPPPFPGVVADDEAFELAVDECREEAWSRIGPAAEDTVRSLERLGSALHNAFVDALRASDAFQELHRRRLSCLAAAGFPARDGAGVWLRPEPGMFPVEFGDVVEVGGAETPPLEPGQVLVVDPPEVRYVPTQDEIELALEDVRCRAESDFAVEAAALAAVIQRDLLAEFEANLTELQIALDELVAGLGPAEGRG